MSDRNTHVLDLYTRHPISAQQIIGANIRGGTWRTSRPRTSIRTIRTTTAAFPQMMLLPSARAFDAMSMSPIFAPGLGDRLGIGHANSARKSPASISTRPAFAGPLN